jgi:uncharacterized cupin superfamily protein
MRPRRLPAEGVTARVRGLGDATGLSRMGVWLRAIPPGRAGTHRHWHRVEEEWAFVLSGTGVVRIGPLRIDVRPGHFVGFPPGPHPHHFVASGDEELVVLEGGERRPEEETVAYPDLGLVWAEGRLEPPSGAFPPEAGDVDQCVHVDDLAPEEFRHDVDGGARRAMRSLHGATGLARQAVFWVRVAAGDRSTAYHSHERTDEWIHVLAGRARVRVGDALCEVGAGDFVGHPAGAPPHAMEAETDLEYLMGGMIDYDDTVIYPEARMRRIAGRLEPIR